MKVVPPVASDQYAFVRKGSRGKPPTGNDPYDPGQLNSEPGTTRAIARFSQQPRGRIPTLTCGSGLDLLKNKYLIYDSCIFLTIMNVVIVRYGELGLKGKNRNNFEDQLARNIRSCLEENKIRYEKVKKIRGRLFVYSDDECACLKDVFGIITFSPAIMVEPEIEHLKDECAKMVSGLSSDMTFRVTATRADKSLAFSSNGVEIALGEVIGNLTGANVNLKDFDFELGVEFYEGRGYMFTDRMKGRGGLPVGTSGKVFVLNDSDEALAAGWLMMRRGCTLALVGGEQKGLGRFSPGKKIKIVDEFPKGEVVISSQRLEGISEIKDAGMVLRPLIGYQEAEIDEIVDEVAHVQ